MNRSEWLGSLLRPRLSFLHLAKRLSLHPTPPPPPPPSLPPPHQRRPRVGAQITDGNLSALTAARFLAVRRDGSDDPTLRVGNSPSF